MLLKSLQALLAPKASRAFYFLYYALGTVVGMGCCWYIAGFPEEIPSSRSAQEHMLSVDSVGSSFQMPIFKAIDTPRKESSDSTYTMQ